MLCCRRCALLASYALRRFFESLPDDLTPLPRPPHTPQHTAPGHRPDQTSDLAHVFPTHNAVADRSSLRPPWSAENLASRDCVAVAVDIVAAAADDCSSECTFREVGSDCFVVVVDYSLVGS